MTTDIVKDSTDATFVQDVIEASKANLVLVDFWAPWCGPCRTLGPAIERVVKSFNGKVKLVKINVDENPHFSGQLRVQSIPAVFAFKDGQPVDGFIGALPESQVKAFVEKHVGAGGGDAIEKMLASAAESMALGDIGGAAQSYAQILQVDSKNPKALAGMARVYLKGDDFASAKETLAMIDPKDANDSDVIAVKGLMNIAAEVVDAPELDAAKNEARENPENLMAKFNLAKAHIKHGDFESAVEAIFEIMKVDLDWNEKAARHLLLKIFDALGPQSELTKTGRRRLSTILFS